MSAVQYVNANAETLKKAHALTMNINAATGLQEVMKSNLGPKGTLKMLVSAGAQIKLTKDGNVLLHEMVIYSLIPANPTSNCQYDCQSCHCPR